MREEVVVSSDGGILVGRRNVSALIQVKEVLDRFHQMLKSVSQWLQGPTQLED